MALSLLLHVIFIAVIPESRYFVNKFSGNLREKRQIEIEIRHNYRETTLTPPPASILADSVRRKSQDLAPVKSADEQKPIERIELNEKSEPLSSNPAFGIEIIPHFPLPLLSKGLRGWISAVFQINKEGAIVEVEILESQPPGVFDSAAITAINSARITEGSTHPGQRIGVTFIFDPAGIQTAPQLSHVQ